MSTMQEASANQKAQAVAEVEETEPKTVESPVKQTPQPTPRRMSGPIGSSHVRDPGDPLFGLTLGQQVLVSRYPGSGGSTPKSPRFLSTPVKLPRRDEPLELLKGTEEPDRSLVEATGRGSSRYIGTPGGIWLHTPTHGPGASLGVAIKRDLM